MEPLLSIQGLKTWFFVSEGVVRAVDGVDLRMNKGETLGLVGESGSGKTMTAFSIMRLIPPPGRIVEGKIFFQGEDLLQKTEREMRKIRGSKIAMSFQDPMTYLNPVKRVGDQIAEAIILHQRLGKQEAMKKAIESMEMVGISSASERARDYPHQLSGGMRQRCLIAMALSCQPDLLIADEPTTALDVIIQAEILDLIRDLKGRLGMAVMLITHDLGIVAQLSDKVAVMYAGNIMEFTDVHTIFDQPRHPYTMSLLDSIPSLESKDRLKTIRGTIPDLLNPPSGCKFQPRCMYARGECSQQQPPLTNADGSGHLVACLHYEELETLGG